MIQPKPCCRTLSVLSQVESPFDAVIALGYYDGPEDGMVHCGGCGREYRFKLLGSRIESDDETETRIFGLSPIPDGSMASFTDAMARYQVPHLPNWVPLWSFPSEEDRAGMDDLVDRIYEEAKPIEIVLASSPWLSGEIHAARAISAPEAVEGKDWFSILGLLKAVVED